MYWVGENGTREIFYWLVHNRQTLAQAAVYGKPPASESGIQGGAWGTRVSVYSYRIEAVTYPPPGPLNGVYKTRQVAR